MTEDQRQHCINVAIDAWGASPGAAGPLVDYALVRILLNEVGNGSFAQYFSNSYGADAVRAAQALRAIVCPVAAGVVDRAIGLFSSPHVLRERAMIDAELDRMEPGVFDDVSDELLTHQDDIEAALDRFAGCHGTVFRAVSLS